MRCSTVRVWHNAAGCPTIVSRKAISATLKTRDFIPLIMHRSNAQNFIVSSVHNNTVLLPAGPQVYGLCPWNVRALVIPMSAAIIVMLLASNPRLLIKCMWISDPMNQAKCSIAEDLDRSNALIGCTKADVNDLLTDSCYSATMQDGTYFQEYNITPPFVEEETFTVYFRDGHVCSTEVYVNY